MLPRNNKKHGCTWRISVLFCNFAASKVSLHTERKADISTNRNHSDAKKNDNNTTPSLPFPPQIRILRQRIIKECTSTEEAEQNDENRYDFLCTGNCRAGLLAVQQLIRLFPFPYCPLQTLSGDSGFFVG